MNNKEVKKEFNSLSKEINSINEKLVNLLNQLERENNFDPFSEDCDTEIKALWDKISIARNYNIY